MIDCKKASELTSKKIDQKLTVAEQLSLKIHVLICSACEMFEIESEVISNCIKKKNENIPILNKEKRRKIQSLIDRHSH